MQPVSLHTLKYIQFVGKLPKLTPSIKTYLVPDFPSDLSDMGFLKARPTNKD